MEPHALRAQGWSISAIARHLSLDRKTVRAHLAGEREAGVRRSSAADSFDAVADYVRQRLVEDPHVRATVLFGEAQKLGYRASYPTFVRHSLSYGGVPVEPKFRHPRPHKPDIMVVADVSGSVAAFARFTLHLVYAISSQFSKVARSCSSTGSTR